MQNRCPSRRSVSLKDRLTEWAQEVRVQAAQLPPGADREALLTKARQADTASRLDDWINSSGLGPPT
jgi:hypothetical protein